LRKDRPVRQQPLALRPLPPKVVVLRLRRHVRQHRRSVPSTIGRGRTRSITSWSGCSRGTVRRSSGRCGPARDLLYLTILATMLVLRGCPTLASLRIGTCWITGSGCDNSATGTLSKTTNRRRGRSRTGCKEGTVSEFDRTGSNAPCSVALQLKPCCRRQLPY
jgi:hypothetical protein